MQGRFGLIIIWIEPKFSKEKVKQAGNSLMKTDVKSPEFRNADALKG